MFCGWTRHCRLNSLVITPNALSKCWGDEDSKQETWARFSAIWRPFRWTNYSGRTKPLGIVAVAAPDPQAGRAECVVPGLKGGTFGRCNFAGQHGIKPPFTFTYSPQSVGFMDYGKGIMICHRMNGDKPGPSYFLAMREKSAIKFLANYEKNRRCHQFAIKVNPRCRCDVTSIQSMLLKVQVPGNIQLELLAGKRCCFVLTSPGI